MIVIDIFIPIDPVAKARPRLGKFGVYTPSKTKKAELLLKSYFNKYEKRSEPCRLQIEFGFKVGDVKKFGMVKATRPDLDNIAKLVMDAMNGTLLHDDGQIYSLTARKIYSEVGYVKLTVVFDN